MSRNGSTSKLISTRTAQSHGAEPWQARPAPGKSMTLVPFRRCAGKNVKRCIGGSSWRLRDFIKYADAELSRLGPSLWANVQPNVQIYRQGATVYRAGRCNEDHRHGKWCEGQRGGRRRRRSGGEYDSPGGLGGRVTATITVRPGENLTDLCWRERPASRL